MTALNWTENDDMEYTTTIDGVVYEAHGLGVATIFFKDGAFLGEIAHSAHPELDTMEFFTGLSYLLNKLI